MLQGLENPALIVLLGDLFKVWLALPKFWDSQVRTLLEGLQRLRAEGTPLWFVVGNREFFLPRHPGLLPDSAAARAKRIQVGDKILKFNGREVEKAIEVIALIHKLGAMQTVTIELKRNNRRITVRQPLGQPGTLNVQ